MLKKQIIKAYNYAQEKHGSKTRAFSGGLPYFSHPKAVARILEDITKNETLVIAGLLHDTVEDTDATFEEIKELFGSEVAALVLEVSSDKEECKQIGKTEYLKQKIKGMSSTALTLKLADRYHNVLYLDRDKVPRKFLEKYYRETRNIFDTPEIKQRVFEGTQVPEQVALLNSILAILGMLKLKFNILD